MDSSVSPKDEIWFLRVCHHISNAVYLMQHEEDRDTAVGTATRYGLTVKKLDGAWAQNMDRWRALVNTVMNLRVP
jgi:hypothetical protein